MTARMKAQDLLIAAAFAVIAHVAFLTAALHYAA